MSKNSYIYVCNLSSMAQLALLIPKYKQTQLSRFKAGLTWQKLLISNGSIMGFRFGFKKMSLRNYLVHKGF